MLVVTACNSPSAEDPPAPDPLSLSVLDVDLEYDAEAPNIQNDRYWAAFVVRLVNGSPDTLPLAFPRFSLASNNGLAYSASEATVLEPNACAIDTSVLPDASASCRVLFSIRTGELPSRITYATEEHSAEAAIEICPDDAAPDLCGHRCVNFETDPDNCGACGAEVETGFDCRDGVPTCRESTFLCDGVCVPEDGNFALCDGVCINLANDPDHCGACGAAVAADETCSSGQPRCKNQNDERCDGRCINTSNDPDNCGSCGTTCPGIPAEIEHTRSCASDASCHVRFSTPGGRCINLCDQLGWTCYNPATNGSCSCAVEYTPDECFCHCVQ